VAVDRVPFPRAQVVQRVPGCKCSERVRGSKVSTFGAGVIISVYQVAWCRPGAAGGLIYSVSMRRAVVGVASRYWRCDPLFPSGGGIREAT
jgi:hypothetical protein